MDSCPRSNGTACIDEKPKIISRGLLIILRKAYYQDITYKKTEAVDEPFQIRPGAPQVKKRNQANDSKEI